MDFKEFYLTTTGNCIRFLVLVGTHAEMLDSLTSVPLASQKYRVGTCRRTQGKLVQSHCLSTSLQDTFLCCLREAESSHGQFWDLNETNIVGDSSD